MFLFLLNPILGIIGAIAQAIVQVFVFVVQVVIAAIRIAVKAAVAGLKMLWRGYRWARGNNEGEGVFELIAFRHFDWMRARDSQEEQDKALEELRQGLGDNDGNGIPDLYDQDYSSGDDPLNIKYPARPLIQNDYVRYLPRAFTLNAQPVPYGAKGLVRSEEVLGGLASASGGGQFCTIKWNMGHMFTIANALDLNLIGHVNNAFRVTE